MLIFPAIDLFGGKAVRLYKGDYDRMTVYSERPVEVAKDFLRSGAGQVHLVDLEGAKDGTTPNFETVCAIKRETGLFCEIGGGIRSMETVSRYLDAGLDRVILGTAAVEDPAFLQEAVSKYGKKIAVGVDIKDGFVAIRGWREQTALSAFDFCKKLCDMQVKTLICTDISKDGAMQGTNRKLYQDLKQFPLNVIASGGVSTIDDIVALKENGSYGAIIGKAYYTGAIDLGEAIEVAK